MPAAIVATLFSSAPPYDAHPIHAEVLAPPPLFLVFLRGTLPPQHDPAL